MSIDRFDYRSITDRSRLVDTTRMSMYVQLLPRVTGKLECMMVSVSAIMSLVSDET